MFRRTPSNPEQCAYWASSTWDDNHYNDLDQVQLPGGSTGAFFVPPASVDGEHPPIRHHEHAIQAASMCHRKLKLGARMMMTNRALRWLSLNGALVTVCGVLLFLVWIVYSCYAPIDGQRRRPGSVRNENPIDHHHKQYELDSLVDTRLTESQSAVRYAAVLDDDPDFQRAVLDSKTLVAETGNCVCSKDVNKGYDLMAVPINSFDGADGRYGADAGRHAQVLLNPVIIPWEQNGMMLVKHTSPLCMHSTSSAATGATLSNLYNKIDVVYEAPKRYGKITATLQGDLAYCVQLKRFSLDGKLPPTSECL